MKQKRFLIPALALGLIFALAGCGEQQVDGTAEAEKPIEAKQGSETEEPKAEQGPVTVEDYRNAIVALGDDMESLRLAQKYYEELLARDAFQENDFLALAEVYALLGDAEEQRDTLWRLYRLYPTEANADILSSLVVEVDDTDGAVVELINRWKTEMEGGNAVELQNLIASEEWKNALWLDTGAMVQKTRYVSAGETIQITSDICETEIACLGQDGEFLYYRCNELGTIMSDATLRDGIYSGPATISYYDAEGALYKQIACSLQNGICVDKIDIFYDGNTYVGKLNENGTTIEEQISKVKGTIYAYSDNGRSYLYQPDTAVADFVIGSKFVGLPEYEFWK